jgi:hypothetical protein
VRAGRQVTLFCEGRRRFRIFWILCGEIVFKEDWKKVYLGEGVSERTVGVGWLKEETMVEGNGNEKIFKLPRWEWEEVDSKVESWVLKLSVKFVRWVDDAHQILSRWVRLCSVSEIKANKPSSRKSTK